MTARGAVAAGKPHDAVDEVVPRWVATPCDEDEIAHLIHAARTERLGALCLGGRTSLAMGNVPRAFDLGIDTRALTATIERCPEDMTVTVRAGTTVEALARDLASVGQRVAWDPDMSAHATIGGVVASDCTGGLTYGFGRPRDLVLGMTVVDGRARTLRVGGRVVKNVAGYDLVRLFTGSHGTLCVITEVTLRTHPLPEIQRTLSVGFADATELDEARAALSASDLPLAALDLAVSDGATWNLLLRIEGSPAEAGAQRDRVAKLCRRPMTSEAAEWLSPAHARAGDDLVVRLGVVPDEAVRAAYDLHRRLGNMAHIGAHLGDGTVRVSLACESPEHTRDVLDAIGVIARERQAVTVIERVLTQVKRGMPVWDADTATLRLVREIKARFDPDGVLAPGRFVGGL